MKLKVYGWSGRRVECNTHHNQTREIVAAKSKAEVARIAGYGSPSRMWNLCETGNKREIETAMSSPGTVFWKPLDDWGGPFNAVAASPTQGAE